VACFNYTVPHVPPLLCRLGNWLFFFFLTPVGGLGKQGNINFLPRSNFFFGFFSCVGSRPGSPSGPLFPSPTRPLSPHAVPLPPIVFFCFLVFCCSLFRVLPSNIPGFFFFYRTRGFFSPVFGRPPVGFPQQIAPYRIVFCCPPLCFRFLGLVLPPGPFVRLVFLLFLFFPLAPESDPAPGKNQIWPPPLNRGAPKKIPPLFPPENDPNIPLPSNTPNKTGGRPTSFPPYFPSPLFFFCSSFPVG